MKTKLKVCFSCGDLKQIWKNEAGKKYCKSCYGKSITGVAKKAKPTAVRIPTFSSKMLKKKALYSVMRVKFLTDHPMCHAKIDARCLQRADCIHHKAGRIEELLLDTRFWLPSCTPCHDYVEKNPDIAKEMGLSIDRLSLKTIK